MLGGRCVRRKRLGKGSLSGANCVGTSLFCGLLGGWYVSDRLEGQFGPSNSLLHHRRLHVLRLLRIVSIVYHGRRVPC